MKTEVNSRKAWKSNLEKEDLGKNPQVKFLSCRTVKNFTDTDELQIVITFRVRGFFTRMVLAKAAESCLSEDSLQEALWQ